MPSEQYLFSIIIPTYNRASLLSQALRSIQAQEAYDIEVIVVDDGSEDNTKQVAKEFSTLALKYHYQVNKGQSVARNLGVDRAKGEYVIFMDDDDYWETNHLMVFRNAIARDDSREVIFRTGFKRVYEDGKVKAAPNYNIKKDGHAVKWAAFNMCSLVCLCIPRKYLIKNRSPVGFQHWQDTHLILRLFAQFPMQQLEAHSYCYRIHNRMGSLQNFDRDHILNRAKTNVGAMDDFFDKYGEFVKPFLPMNTLKCLKAEKYLEYAQFELISGNRKHHLSLFRDSINNKIALKFWKGYLYYFYLLVRGFVKR